MKRAARWTCQILAAFPLGDLAAAQATERVSLDSAEVQGNHASYDPSISADGRFVAFWSQATNLVAGDTNGFYDVFVRDRQSGATERVSVDSAGVQGNAQSVFPVLSADGHFVAFYSYASNLVAGDTNGCEDVFVRDRLNGTTARVSLSTSGSQGNLRSAYPSISADGRFVAFWSQATILVAGDTNGFEDVFVRDLLLGTTERVSVDSAGAQANYGSFDSSLSADGRFVAFHSVATNLVAGDANASADVFVRDRLLGTTERVSVDSAGAEGNSTSAYPSLSADGCCVAFYSHAANLVGGDTNGAQDIFVHDRLSGTTERVSVSTAGVEGNGASFEPSLSADGRFVAFESNATNLVAGDTLSWPDVFVRDRQNGTTERVSVSSTGAQANSASYAASISPDARFVAFHSVATNLVAGDTNARQDVFVRNRGAPVPVAFCLGDGSAGACPCANDGLPGRGCENSSATGGAVLVAAGSALLTNDTLVLTSSGELPAVASVFFQGTTALAPAAFGDGMRCVGGTLKRLYTHNAAGGIVSAPQPGDPSISARSAALGDVLVGGSTRHYQTYYRDPQLAFCPDPPGNGWNISSGITVVWGL